MTRFRAAAIAAAIVLLGIVAWRFVENRRASPASSSSPSATFVGTTTCASCHQEQHRAWTGSHHDLAMQPATSDTVRGDFSGVRVPEGAVTSTFFERGGRYFVNTDAPDGTLQDFEIKYTFGVDPLQQYLIELPDGRVQALSIAWDTRPREAGGQRWFHLYAGQGIAPGDDVHWSGAMQNWNFMCADCHSTGLRKGYDAAARQFTTTSSEINVGCEACHGPGSRHVDWANATAVTRRLLWRDNGLQAQLTERQGVTWITDAGQPRRSMPRTTNREIETCAQCHSRRAQVADGYTAGAPFHDFYVPDPLVPRLYHADGQQRDEVYTYGSFLQSRMHAAGVTCSDCHEPHSQRLRAEGNQLCARCHSAASFDTPAHHFHPGGSAAAQCVSCHMPPTTYMVVDPRRDHSFGVPRPDRTVALGTPNACTGCHTDRTPQWAAETLRGRLGRDAAGFQRFAETFHAAEQQAAGVGAALRGTAIDQTQPAVVRASALARLRNVPGTEAVETARAALRDRDPAVRWQALAVLERLPPRDRAGTAAPLLADPVRSVRIQAAWLLAPAAAALAGTEAAAAFDRAAAEFIASQRFNADRPENRLALGTFFMETGRAAEAEAEYRAALAISPRYVPASVNLADLLRRLGRSGEAEQQLRAGLVLSPGDAALRHALGVALIGSGNIAAALVELEAAATAASERPDYAYTYAVALNGAGRGDQAISVLQQAEARHPADPQLLFALSTFHRDSGRRGEAARYAELLTRLGDPRGRALLDSFR